MGEMIIQSKGLIQHWKCDKTFTKTGTHNLVLSGDFASATGWVLQNPPWSIGSGVLTSDGSQSTTKSAYQLDSVTVGNQIKITFTLTFSVAGGQVRCSAGPAGTGTLRTANGTYSEILTAAGNNVFYVSQSGNFNGYVDNVSAYDTTGSLLDQSASGNAGEIYGATWATGRRGGSNKALLFDGTNDYVLPANGSLWRNASFTMRVWIKPTSATTYGIVQSGNDGAYATNNWLLYYGSAQSRLVFSGRTNGKAASSSVIPLNSWTCATVVVDATAQTYTIYINGVNDGIPATAALVGTDNTSGEYFGRAHSGLYFNGSMSDFKIVNYAMSASEVLDDYRGVAPDVTIDATIDNTSTYDSQTVVSGTLHLSTKDSEAMFFHDTLSFSGAVGKRIVFVDAAGKTATAYGYAAGGGESLDSELITGWTNLVGSAYETFTVNANGHDIDSAINTTGQGVGYTNNFGNSGSLYKIVADITLNSGQAASLYSKTSSYTLSTILISRIIDKTYYYTFNSTDNGLMLLNNGTEGNFSLLIASKKYLNVPSTGLLLSSTKTGSTRNMTSVESGFNPNTVVAVRVYRSPVTIQP